MSYLENIKKLQRFEIFMERDINSSKDKLFLWLIFKPQQFEEYFAKYVNLTRIYAEKLNELAYEIRKAKKVMEVEKSE